MLQDTKGHGRKQCRLSDYECLSWAAASPGCPPPSSCGKWARRSILSRSILAGGPMARASPFGRATLRAFVELGILDEFLKHGSAAEGGEFFTASGHPIATMPTPRLAGPDVPPAARSCDPRSRTFSQRRPARRDRTCASARRSPEIDRWSGRRPGRVERRREATYDLVVGADGLYSKMRKTFFPDAPAPRYIGQCVWRAVLKRPPEVRARNDVDRRQGQGRDQSGLARRDVYVRDRGSSDERMCRSLRVRAK